MKKFASIFPGQGSQYTGMGKDLYTTVPAVRSIFDRADAFLKRSLRDTIFNSNDETLRRTENTQPALYTVSCALFDAFKEKGFFPSAFAGHSIGEYTALYAAGAFSFEDGLKLVEARGRFIRECSHQNPGTMCAILGLSKEKIAGICSDSTHKHPVEAVNFNCPGQIVIAGSREAVQKAEHAARDAGALKTVHLNVSGPFHSSLMSNAAHMMKTVLDTVSFKDISLPVISNCDAAVSSKKEDIKHKLFIQIDHPVLWEDTIHTIHTLGIDTFVEIGPGKILSGLNRRINKKFISLNIEDTQSFNSTIELLSRSAISP